MKDIIKNFDNKYLNNKISKLYHYFFYDLIEKIELRKITTLPKNLAKHFDLYSRYNFFKRAQYYLQVNRINGVYMEFGSHEVNTFRMALRTLGLPKKPNNIYKFYAFDSFEGMPEPEGIDKQKIWKRSMNYTSLESFLKIVKKDLHRVQAIKGYYNVSLKNFNYQSKHPIALAYLDCDYYSSTVECLNFIKDKLQHGCLIAFDDWDCYYADPQRGQRLAFNKFKEEMKNSHYFEDLCDIPSGGKCFVTLEINKLGKEIL